MTSPQACPGLKPMAAALTRVASTSTPRPMPATTPRPTATPPTTTSPATTSLPAPHLPATQRPASAQPLPGPTPHPTLDEPLPTLAGTPGLRLLRSSPAARLAEADLDADQRAQLDATCCAIVAACQPATLADIATTLERLSLHYPQLRRTEAEARLHVRDWAEDFADYPPDLIAEAARLWRNSTAERYPTPGQLKALVERVWDHRRRLGERAEVWMGVMGSNR